MVSDQQSEGVKVVKTPGAVGPHVIMDSGRKIKTVVDGLAGQPSCLLS